jgi:azurin
MRSSLVLLTGALALAACGTDAAPEPGPAPAAEAPAPAATEAAVSFDGPPARVSLGPVGDAMEFNTKEFTVAPGQEVQLSFTNSATSAAMRHNVVVLDLGADVDAFGTAAMAAADTDFIPPALADQVVAHTAMSDPGETVELTFTAPSKPGDYTYICTFPGHFMVMRGVMRVVA